MIETQVSDAGFRSIGLELEPPHEDELAAVTEMLVAVDALSHGWLEPLAVGFLVQCCDRDNFMERVPDEWPAQPSWFLQAAEVPTGITLREPFADPAVHVEQRLDAETVNRWVAWAVAQPCRAPYVTSLDEVQWTSTRARMPIDDAVVVKDGAEELPARFETRDGIRWAAGPSHGRVPSPIRIRAVNNHSVMSIRLTIHWDVWIEHPSLVDDAIGRVLARPGWRVGD